MSRKLQILGQVLFTVSTLSVVGSLTYIMGTSYGQDVAYTDINVRLARVFEQGCGFGSATANRTYGRPTDEFFLLCNRARTTYQSVLDGEVFK